jgi:hypothetical protein
MREHRVGVMNLCLSGAAIGEVELSCARQFAEQCLQRAGDELERRFPGRIFAIRILPLQWRVSPQELASPRAVTLYAQEIADAVSRLQSGEGQVHGFGEVRIFEDRQNFWVAYLADRIQGRSERLWAYKPLEHEANPGAQLLDHCEDQFIVSVLRLVAQRNFTLLSSVLNYQPLAQRLAQYFDLGQAENHLSILPKSDADSRELQKIIIEHLAGSPTRDRAEETAFGGLAYLLNVLVELDVGEIIWKVCLDERVVLWHVLYEFVGQEDPVIDALSGITRTSLVIMDLSQRDEICQQVQRSLELVLVRNGFSLDAPPHNQPKHIDPGGDIVSTIASAAARLFSVRLKLETVLSPPELAREFFASPARIVLGHTRLTVVLPMESISIDVRRAGLDRDPGWIPWLRKTVRLEFEDVGYES